MTIIYYSMKLCLVVDNGMGVFFIYRCDVVVLHFWTITLLRSVVVRGDVIYDVVQAFVSS